MLAQPKCNTCERLLPYPTHNDTTNTNLYHLKSYPPMTTCMESVALGKHPWSNNFRANSMESAATASCKPRFRRTGHGRVWRW